MQDKYVDKDNNKSKLITLPSDKPNVSRKENSLYLRPYQIVEANNKFYNGYNWTAAHYLSPIAFEHFGLPVIIAAPLSASNSRAREIAMRMIVAASGMMTARAISISGFCLP